jgi:hypothetical protein
MTKQKLMGFLLLLISIKAYTQTFTFKSTLDLAFANVNKSSISTGLLQQAGYPTYNLALLTGQSSDTAIIANFDQWRDVYKALATSYINSSSQLPNAATGFETGIQNLTPTSNVIIPVLLYNYHSLKDSLTLTQCFTVSNKQFFDISNRTVNPYIQKTVFAAAPAITA